MSNSRLLPRPLLSARQVLRNQVAGAMQQGPQALRELFELFDADGDEKISHAELRDVLVDFGLALTDRQARGFPGGGKLRGEHSRCELFGDGGVGTSYSSTAVNTQSSVPVGVVINA